MTERAWRDLRVLADSGNKVAGVFADSLRAALDSGKIPSHVPIGLDTDIVRHPSGLVLDPSTRKLTGPEDETTLPPIQNDLLVSFMQDMGRVIPSREIETQFGWEFVNRSGETPLKVNLTRLRQKMLSVGGKNEQFPMGYLLTVRGSGYVMVDTSVPAQVERFMPYARYKGNLVRER